MGTGIDGQSPTKKSTGQIKRQGHTAGPYGNDPSFSMKGKVDAERDLKP